MTPIITGTFKLLKDQKKGGWTYLYIPFEGKVPPTRFGMRKVNGHIDDFELKDFTMWTMKKKGHFIAVKADIRKAIGKEEGDSVRLVLFADELPDVAPDDLIVCLKEEPALHDKFMALEQKKRDEISAWVFAAASEDLKVARIGKVLEGLETGKIVMAR